MRLGSNNQTVEVEVVLGRRLIGTFMTIYMPTILLNIIGHSTNYFKPFFFEAIVTVNLTVSYTTFIKVQEKKPHEIILGYVSADHHVRWSQSDPTKDKQHQDG